MDMEFVKLVANIKARNIQMESLLDLIFDGAELSWNKKRLSIGNEETIMAYIKTIEPDAYASVLDALQKKDAEEEAKKTAADAERD